MSPLQKIKKANRIYVWSSNLGMSVQVTKKEAKRILNMSSTLDSPSYNWELKYHKSIQEHWLQIN